MNGNNDNKVVIKQVGYTYIFQISTMISPKEQERIREEIIQQMKEGIVFLLPAVKLISVEPHLETFIEPQGKSW